jgi:tetratricopeptide (TPR) repeat protein
MAIPLGPFDLLEPVGKGGMAVVWKGVHREQRIPVAVKVLQPQSAEFPDGAKSFRQEIRAVSALDHPSIVLLFDHGQIPADAAAQSEGRLPAGAPYLVMEFASRGTLRAMERASGKGPGRPTPGEEVRNEPTSPTEPSAAPISWARLRNILLSLLDALAHAHARGVLHRDLKPDNVLICGPTDLRPGIKLSDFGIARPLDDGDAVREDKPVGTPHYMAPEQLQNDRSAYGPHTDLYALGHLGWRLATGRLAWHGLSGASLVYAQLRKSPPAFVPQFPVPEGFEAFLRTLLAKAPHARYQRAADAALALSQLPDPDGGGSAEAAEPAEAGTLRILIGGRRGTTVIDPELRPPLPGRFPLDAEKPPVRLLGAGLGLFGLRPVPFVGRAAELQRAWRELARVHAEGRPRAVVVRGGAGIGKSRFLARIAERAHELGAANVLTAGRSASRSVLDRFAEPLVRFLHAHPLDPTERERRFGDFLRGLRMADTPLPTALALLLDPEAIDLPELQRFGILQRTLELVAVDRPLVVVCDDAEDSPDVLRLARQLLAARDRGSAPILLLLGVGEEDPALERHLGALSAHEGVTTLALEPFGDTAHRSLVRSVAALAPSLEEQVAAWTAGNPLHAVQTITDWVDRDALVSGPDGYGRAPTEEPEPQAMDDVWDRRIRTVVSGIEAPAIALLERAAVAGPSVDVFEWQAACDDPDGAHAAQGQAMFQPRRARVRAAIVESLLETGLARATDTGFAFTWRDFRRALVERARRAGRFRGHAAAFGATLAHRVTDANALRTALFFLEAQDAERALPLLLRAEAWQRRSQGPQAALETLARAEEVAKALRLPPGDRRTIELWTRRAELLERTGARDDAQHAALLARRLAETLEAPDLAARAEMVLGAVSLAAGRPEEAEGHWTAALDRLGPDGPVVETVRARHWLRRVAIGRRGPAEVALRGRRLREAGARATTEAEQIPVLLALAEHHVDVGESDEAAARASEVVERATERRDHGSAAKAWSILASVAERDANWSGAREAWARVVELLEDLGDDRRTAAARCRWGFAECRAGRFPVARAVVERAAREAERNPTVRAGVQGVLALAAAGAGSWSAHDRAFDAFAADLPRVPIHHRAPADLCLFGAELARAAGREDRERKWLELARARLVVAPEANTARWVVTRLEALGT